MKSAEGLEGTKSNNKKDENIKSIVAAALKTMAMLEKPFGQSYLTQILLGDFKYDPKHPSHISLETYGVAAGKSSDYLTCIFQMMVEKQMIEPIPPGFNTIRTTEVGMKWLEDPQDWFVPRWKTQYRKRDIFLRNKLRDHRYQLSKSEGMDTWLIFSNYTLEALVRMKPIDFQSLSKVPGMTTYKCEHFGASVIATIMESNAQFDDIVRASTLVKVGKGSYPKIQQMFSEGYKIPTIAEALGIKISTVSEHLRELHAVGKVDLIPWIEKEVPSKELFKGVEYFKNVKNPTVKEAFETLGIAYETLHYCKLYVADFKRQEAQLSISA